MGAATMEGDAIRFNPPKNGNQPDHLDHLESIFPQIVIILNILIMFQKQALF